MQCGGESKTVLVEDVSGARREGGGGVLAMEE